jgi:cell wall-associated NlpC family hydrolase
MRARTVVPLALAPLAALVLFVVVIVAGASGGGVTVTASAATSQTCSGSGPIKHLGAAQAANARAVVAVAEQMGGRPGAVIAVSVGLAESGLRDLGNPNVPGSGAGQGSGSNADSIGIFQQRASWGTVAQRLDPATSTKLFMTRLLADTGWRVKPPWVAAQDVQRSAYDGRPRPANHGSSVYGGNYQATLDQAQQIVGVAASGATNCDTLTGGVSANVTPGSHGLPDHYSIPATATPNEAKVVAYALAQLDKPYVFNTAGPDSFDCSGLTMAAWARAGVTLPHYTGTQARAGSPVSNPNLMVPGDLILVPGDDGTLAAPGHVGMYIGDGLVINASDPTDGIRVQTYADFINAGHGLSAIRHIK